MRRLVALFAIALCAALYLSNLSRMGLVSVDEPRYAAIGQAMAQSGDWITPRLWGEPWFEKPALLYWLTGIGFRAGLGPELAPRLPVALFSLAFLTFFWFRLRTLWDATVASYSTAILATSTGWLAYSHVAITDLPLAACFAAAVLWSLEEAPSRRETTLAAAALGFAVLAKSLVGLVLFLPVLAMNRKNWRAWFQPAPLLAFTAIAVPWHVLCAMSNGQHFFQVLFVEHQFGRFNSGAMQHQQRFWYYVPVLLMLLFPWFPLAASALRERSDRRVRVLWAVVGFGFVFFSASVNKLPHYLLPLLPLVAVLLGLGLARSARAPLALAGSVALLGLLPMAVMVAPGALAHGLGATAIPWSASIWIVASAVAGWLVAARLRRAALPFAFGLAGAAFLWFQFAAFPAIDAAASARPMWLREHPGCAPRTERYLVYGLSYYAGKAIEVCQVLDPQGDSVVR
ncbi:MAG TPA: glycosyltransferase family 39 protein [Bryobacteraceae bacterium]|nr:glycosyltransferase family 39 protein [Bryobacteraceae bacterium]